jgi:DNA polymerase III subunit gamma/tau
VSQALYRKYRSKSLADVVGQDHITDILSRALKSGRIAHAYLFTGPRGVGKTSIARILAHEINQLPYTENSHHLDIIEIDAASNNGVEDVRDLREKVQIAPVSASKKVYIIDEVHMLSKPAFNALLKTLEEPPEHIVFILATTDVEKLPATIISRTQRYGFRAINQTDAISHLKNIASKEKITITDEAVKLIAERGDGSFRDSISLLDQLASLADTKEGITKELVEISLGLAPGALIDTLLQAVEKHDVKTIAATLTQVESDGISPAVLTDQLTQAVRTQAIDKPHLLTLLDALLDVPKSSNPSMKLLSVLGTTAYEHRPKTAALATPVLEVTATIEELSKQATVKHPKVEPKTETPTTSQTITPTQVLEEIKKPIVTNDVEFAWDALIAHTKEHFVALYSVLSKCVHEIDGTELKLYCQNNFYKKKLDDAKYSTHLYESLAATGGYQLTVHTIATRAPLKDSQAEAIADIMGGGIEVAPEVA